MIKILHKPQIVFPKYTIMYEEEGKKTEILHVANSVNPSELLEMLGIQHTYKIEVEVKDEK